MARLSLGLAGAAIGSIGGMPGAGFLVGSAIGSILFPGPAERWEGPRPGDLSIMSSAYGRPIGVGWGTMRTGVNVQAFYRDRIVERVEDVGGKGGPSAETVNWDRFVSFAAYVVTGPIERITRIWADRRLIYDVTAESAPAPPSQGNWTFRFYHGDEDQLPDPLEIEKKGEDRAKAYRGVAYIVFEDFYLNEFGSPNRFPNIEVEYSAGPQAHPWVRLQHPMTSSFIGVGDFCLAEAKRAIYWYSELYVWKADAMTGEILARSRNLQEFSRNHAPGFGIGTPTLLSRYTPNSLCVSPQGDVYVSWGLSTYSPVFKLDPDTLQVVAQVGHNRSGGPFTPNPAPFDQHISGSLSTLTYHHGPRVPKPDGGFEFLWEVVLSITDTALSGWPHNAAINAKTMQTVAIGGQLTGVGGRSTGTMDEDGDVWIFTSRPTFNANAKGLFHFKLRLHHTPTPSDPGWELIRPSPGVDGINLAPQFPSSGDGDPLITYYRDEHALICAVTGANRGLIKYDIAAAEVTGSLANAVASSRSRSISSFRRGPVDGFLFTIQQFSTGRVAGIALSGQERDPCGAEMDQFGDGINAKHYFARDWEVDPEWSTFIGDALYDPITRGIWLADGTQTGWGRGAAKIFLCRFERECVPLCEVIKDLCELAGIARDRVVCDENVTQLVCGYSATRQEPVRRALEQLMTAYNVQIIEEDWVLKVRTRTGESQLTVPHGHLVPERRGRPVMQHRDSQRSELPRRMSITYLDIDQDHQVGNQPYDLPSELVETNRELTAELPLVLTPDEAYHIVERNLHIDWTASRRIEVRLPPRYLRVSVGDVLTVLDHDGDPFLGRVIEGRLIPGAYVAALTLERDDPRAHQEVGIGGTPLGTMSPTIARPGATQLLLLNAPMLDERHDDAGYYLAAGPLSAGGVWPGATVLSSSDGSTWTAETRVTDPATFGRLATELPPIGPGLWTFDESQELLVWLTHGELETAPSDLAVINGANTLAVGDELVSFREAEQLDDRTWRLRRILRGRGGTWWIGGHAVGTQVVKLNEAWLLNRPAALSSIGVPRLYRARTLGSTIGDLQADAIEFTNEGARLRTYPPVHVRGTRDGSNNLTVTAERCTRTGFRLRDFYDQPLAEAVERYTVELRSADGSTLLRTLTPTTLSITYTAAQQTADGHTPGDPVMVIWRQDSDDLGPGPAVPVVV